MLQYDHTVVGRRPLLISVLLRLCISRLCLAQHLADMADMLSESLAHLDTICNSFLSALPINANLQLVSFRTSDSVAFRLRSIQQFEMQIWPHFLGQL